MKWVKKGLIYSAKQENNWALSHAALPTPYLVSEKVLRIYCAFRAKRNVSRVGYVDVCADNPKDIVGISPHPALDVGQPGNFDDNGVVPASIVNHEDKVYLYYSGFQLGVNVPYYLFSGLAISTDTGYSFTRYKNTPILEPSDNECFFRTAPHVIKDGTIWKMWYIAGSDWVEHNGKQLPIYTVKYLTSPDGTTWEPEGRICLHTRADEHGFGRPYVVEDGDNYKMYYSIRTLSNGYRLGYAESNDGIDWTRKDHEMELDVSIDGWDSKAVCYSSIIECKGRTYLFYNGNNYGETGFGYAELDV